MNVMREVNKKQKVLIIKSLRAKWGLWEMNDDTLWTTYCEAMDLCLTDSIIITKDHAHSLTCLVQWFKKMITSRGVGTMNLTAEYCDELIKDLDKKE